MFGLSTGSAEAAAKLAALDRSQGIIEFDLDGNVLSANANFLALMGYTLAEAVGRHHGTFVDPAERASEAYRAFWARLKSGSFETGRYRRIARDGREVWIEASYNPILDRHGRPSKVVKFATDITRQVAEDADRQGQITAIRAAQAVIAFDLDGNILEANDNFLNAVGYTLPEIVGRHHSLFVEPAYAASAEYRAFWAALKAGTYQAGQYRRLGRGGRPIWIEASYNPILDASGRPYKVVKFATDVTAQIQLLDDIRRLIERNFGEIDTAILRSDQEAGTAAQAAGIAAGTVQTMAAASEELAASVAEISHSMVKSRAATDASHAQVAAAGAFTQQLAGAAAAMGSIVGLIQTIAGQINLLALNATIESARAGEAGRGFAVVAQEVKNLANQAAQATRQISDEIDSIQGLAQQVVGALGTMQGSVETMRDMVVATATAVEEQSVVTREMSGNMQEAARAVTAIASSAEAITRSVADVSTAVSSTKEAARALAR